MILREVCASADCSIVEERPVIFVVDDDQSVRSSVEFLLKSVELDVQTFKSAGEFLQAERPNQPSCLVLDVRLPGVSGLDFQTELSRLNLNYPIIFISGHGDIAMAVRAIQSGAAAFLTKPFQDQELVDAVHKALDRDREHRRERRSYDELKRRFESLSWRERQVFALAVTGIQNKQIAATLDVGESTVKAHRASAMKKMQANSFADLIRMADKISVRRFDSLL
jgi:FixJ family two-component response regulator